ncbi:rod shape-determining protein MreB [Streptomyces sp. Amel2xB2]|uniref:rod shape-determining protein n=1 Tax=Streptomyces sp. Amel2xB2 TaxID=1305829 RepID=UPI000DB9CD41|nr:rod shape-determining protein [Streptomyces sp. Amel2xB2]RAJ60001.1 rod shape-determining protein MreB [Streptomyces sp. Amel2xB2]
MNEQAPGGVPGEERGAGRARFRRYTAASPSGGRRPSTGPAGNGVGAEPGAAPAGDGAPSRAVSLRHKAWPASRQCPDIALDLGSARTRAWTLGKRVILDVRTVAFPGTGQSYPVRRGAIVDPEATAQMLGRLLGNRTSRFSHPVIAVTAPTLGGSAFREAARAAVRPLQPRAVFTVPSAEAIALGAGADTARPLLIVDVGAQLTEVFLLTEGTVTEAHCMAVGTDDLGPTECDHVVDYVADVVTEMLRQDRSANVLDALRRGVLTAGGGALRPELTWRLTERLHAPVRPAPAPHTVAVRGAGRLVQDLQGRTPGENAYGASAPPRP